jgi:hypothetical protein
MKHSRFIWSGSILLAAALVSQTKPFFPVVLGAPAVVDIVVSQNAPPAIRFGADELQGALEKTGHQVQQTPDLSIGKIHIVIAERGASILSKLDRHRLDVPDLPESYSLTVLGTDSLLVEGSDVPGAMYGALDLAEQIIEISGTEFVTRIRPINKSPYLAIRGINTFLTPQAFDDPDSWYWSDSFWDKYFKMMARNRFNFLDLHGPFDLTLGSPSYIAGWPNGFAFFVSLPDFREVGAGPERAAKNLARFHQIIRMASALGIKVGFMNYAAAPPLGPWKTGRFWKDDRFNREPYPALSTDARLLWNDNQTIGEGGQRQLLTGPRLERYTREAVTAFLKELPELWMFGFRVGESLEPEEFYIKTYLEALKEVPNTSLNIYARTHDVEPKKMRQIANLAGHHFYIEPKYNGEQLGLPYQAVTGGRNYPRGGSYEDYTNYPRNYSIIWQVRASGTHRVFHWGSPEFVRRTVESCKFGGGVGFTLEPMNAYNPQTDYLHNNPQTDHKVYDWMFEEQWFWYMVWGRTAYDPDVSEQVWLRKFRDKFGDVAGPLTYKALVENSKIIPFIYSYHAQGLSQTHMAPEFETGDHSRESRVAFWQGDRIVPFGGDIKDFLRVGVLDRTAMSDPASYVSEYLKHVVTGKMHPFEAATYLGASADLSEREIADAAKMNPTSTKEFDCIERDVKAVAWLGRYYRDRILSATHLEFYLQTYDHPELSAAYEYLERAIDDWNRLSAIADEHFGYVPDLIRMKTYNFRWQDEGRSLRGDLEEINQLEAEFQALPRNQIIIGHVPQLKVKPNLPLTLEVTFASATQESHLYLFYRNSHSTLYQKVPLKLQNQFERTWAGEIPADSILPGYLEYYFEADMGVGGEAYGGTLDQRSAYLVLVNDNDFKPQIRAVPPTGSVQTDSVSLTTEVRSHARIKDIWVWYKRMPSYSEWIRMPMKALDKGLYQATVPLTPEGILYFFEAIDEDGNAAHYPDFMKQTPYFAINGWSTSEEQVLERDR